MALGKGLRWWRRWHAVGPSPPPHNKTLSSAPVSSQDGCYGTGARHGAPRSNIYRIYLHSRPPDPPALRHRYVHKAKCKYLNALDTELKKRSLHNTARGPGPPSPKRRQHDGTARTTHTRHPAWPPSAMGAQARGCGAAVGPRGRPGPPPCPTEPRNSALGFGNGEEGTVLLAHLGHSSGQL